MEFKRGNNRKIRTRCTSEQLGREVWPFCINNMYDSQAKGIHQVVNASQGSTAALRIKLSEMTQVKLSKRERKTNLLLLSSEIKCKEESKETKVTDRDPRRHLPTTNLLRLPPPPSTCATIFCLPQVVSSPS